MSEKILFVDDEPSILNGYSRLLRGEFDIETAVGAQEALTALERQTFAVAVVDMRMPEMDGAQLLARITVKYPETIRVMLTGNSDIQTAVRAVNEGNIYRFLTKPCNKELLTQTLNAALVQYRLTALKQENLGTVAAPATPRKKAQLPAGLVEIEGQVKKILENKNVTIRTPSMTGAVYVGKTIWEGPDYVVQSVSGSIVIAHPKKALDKVPPVGTLSRIEYNFGSATVQEVEGS